MDTPQSSKAIDTLQWIVDNWSAWRMLWYQSEASTLEPKEYLDTFHKLMDNGMFETVFAAFMLHKEYLCCENTRKAIELLAYKQLLEHLDESAPALISALEKDIQGLQKASDSYNRAYGKRDKDDE